ncbi:CsgG/HfaB family protein [Brucepastera parasyntrophica]|uniref:CsgG/HfaB family protein n=1 Tax=Brucepastera parasyntrophica TaxID=2880008 RepID=UPI00210863BD|nr:CsgG/HfaB family protein [Brucepastera parasyntrophica]ULQ59261.1 CsgG/HfaB family protein [Brucepastera parasyntrophica]
MHLKKNNTKDRPHVFSALGICGPRLWAAAILVICLSAGCSSSPETVVPDGLDSAILEGTAYLNQNIPEGTKLAIIAVKSDYPALSEYVIDTLTENIVNGRSFTVVERNQLDVIRTELHFQMSGDVDDNSAQAIGQMAGAQTIVVGAVSALGNKWRLSLRALTVEKAEVQGLFSKNIPDTGIMEALTSGADTAKGRPADGDTAGQAQNTLRPLQSVTTTSQTSKLQNGMYTLMPRPRGRLNGVWEDIYISRIEVDNEYITIFFENKETAGDGYGRIGSVNWDAGYATLIDLDRPSVYKKNTGRTGKNNGYIVSCVFQRIDGKRLRMENRQGIIFTEITLGNPD